MEHVGKITLRHLEPEDYPALKEAMAAAYQKWTSGLWREEDIKRLLAIFPQGQIAIFDDEVLVGCSLSLIINYDHFGDDHDYKSITGNYTFDTHSPVGDVLYGIDTFVRPEYRGMRLGRRLYDARRDLCERLNLRGIVFGGRIPGFHKYPDLSPRQYLEKVKQREIKDPTLDFQLANDFRVVKILKNYLVGDHESREYAVLLKWDNIYYEKKWPTPGTSQSIVRLGLIQWQMRPYADADELFMQIEFFIDSVAGYNADFALLPEFFNAPLMANFNDRGDAEAMRKLAGYSEEVRTRLQQLAVAYNVNIVGGSMPHIGEDNKLYNVGYVYRRNGTSESYSKLHITPDEARAWGMYGGSEVKVIQTDCGPIGVLICYDVEFPEPARLMAEQNMRILFVPFHTDTQNAYSRVRYCARARAIENECYVAIAGSVGNLPKVDNMDVRFAQSAVFTPCDFAFPSNGIKAEATANTEMILLADVDLDLLRELHRFGTVRNLQDRRLDVYRVYRENHRESTET